MLLRRLSSKVRAEVEATNRRSSGQAVSPRIADVREDTFNPLQLDQLPPDFVSRVVGTQDAIPEVKRHNNGYMHLSELLHDVCPRQVILTDRNPTKRVYQAATGGHRVMWKLGRAVEAHVRDSYIRGVKGKGVLGVWSCKCGNRSETGLFSTDWVNCRRCDSALTNYGEVTLFDHDAGIVGNVDLPIYIGQSVTVVEIKSMNGEEFDALQAPIPDHVYQAAGYRRLLIKRGDLRVSDTIIIHYSTKKFKFGKPYKEFHINASDPTIDRVLDGVWQRASDIKRHRLEQSLPARELCRSSDSPRARKCVHCGECWSRSEP